MELSEADGFVRCGQELRAPRLPLPSTGAYPGPPALRQDCHLADMSARLQRSQWADISPHLSVVASCPPFRAGPTGHSTLGQFRTSHSFFESKSREAVVGFTIKDAFPVSDWRLLRHVCRAATTNMPQLILYFVDLIVIGTDAATTSTDAGGHDVAFAN
jgi:hypothetical protein